MSEAVEDVLCSLEELKVTWCMLLCTLEVAECVLRDRGREGCAPCGGCALCSAPSAGGRGGVPRAEAVEVVLYLS